MRICMFVADFPYLSEKGKIVQGGGGACVLQLTDALARKAVDVSVVTARERNLKGELLDIPITRVSYPYLGFRESKMVSAFSMAMRDYGDFDVIHSHNPPGAIAAMGLAHRREIPHLLTMHGPWADVRGALFRQMANVFEGLALRSADRVTADSDSLRLRLIGKHKIPESRITTIINAIEPEIFRPRLKKAARKALSLPSDKKIVLFTGRFVKEKGIDVLLDAIPSVGKEDFLFLLVGGGFDETLIDSWLRENPGAPVKKIPYLPYERMPMLYNAADAFVLPSYEEGMSRSVLEAMASGTPVVASDIPANREVLEKGNGAIFEAGNSKDLAEKISGLLSDEKKSKIIASNARKFIEKNATVKERVRRFMQEYKRLAG